MSSPIPKNSPPNPPSQSASLAAEPHGNRCEITPKVRVIAQRTQNRMFQRTGLFFNEATFQVPNTVLEAFENMHLGTSDLDKNDPRATSGLSDLYLISWSNTQFFSAQMAGLGFRFISCNLRKKPGLKQPPPVEKWLRLERLPARIARRPSTHTQTTIPRTRATPAPTKATPAPTQATPAPTQATPAPAQATPAPTQATSPPTQTASAPTRTTPAPQSTPAPVLPSSRVQNTPQPSTTPLRSQSVKRPQPPQPSSDRAPSPPTKIQRRPNGIGAPSQPRSPPQPPKRNVISSSNKPPHDPTQSSVPIIDLT